jgi:hypothetical protein
MAALPVMKATIYLIMAISKLPANAKIIALFDPWALIQQNLDVKYEKRISGLTDTNIRHIFKGFLKGSGEALKAYCFPLSICSKAFIAASCSAPLIE